MSRVDDDRNAARVAERIALQKREAEAKSKEKVQSDSAFSRLVGKGTTEKQFSQQMQTTKASSVIAQLKAEMGEAASEATHTDAHSADASSKSDDASRSAQSNTRSKLGEKSLGETKLRAQNEGSETSTAGRMSEESAQGMASKGRSEEGASTGRASEGRASDSRKTSESLEEKGSASVGKGSKNMGQKGDLKADSDTGKGSGGGQQKDGKQEPGGVPASFRFNPSLMAPVPVAQSRDMAGNERLRRIANEIAQKIVEKVRVGKNAAGAAEFQIDLRTNVLAGLSIKVSSQHGKISMIFSGRDKETLKYIEEQAAGLRESLSSRGLKLADLKFENIS